MQLPLPSSIKGVLVIASADASCVVAAKRDPSTIHPSSLKKMARFGGRMAVRVAGVANAREDEARR